MAHKDIRKPFTFEGCRYAAVGFLEEKERSTNWKTILARVPDAVGEEDGHRIHANMNSLPNELFEDDDTLFTNRDNGRGGIQYFYRTNGAWRTGWLPPDASYDNKAFVIVRLP